MGYITSCQYWRRGDIYLGVLVHVTHAVSIRVRHTTLLPTRRLPLVRLPVLMHTETLARI